MVNIAGGEARRATFDQEAANAILGLGPDDCQVRETTIGDPHLRAVQDIAVPITTRCRAHAPRITSGIGFREPKTSNHFTLGHTRQPALLLLLRAKSMDREHGKRTLYGDKRAQTAVASLQFLAGESIANSAQSGAAIAFEMHSQQ